MYRPPDGVAALDSQQLREAMDAATVRAIDNGGYQALEAKYFASDAFDSVAAITLTLTLTQTLTLTCYGTVTLGSARKPGTCPAPISRP